MKSTVQVRKAGHYASFSVKTAHARSPKKYLDENMKDCPGGTWITMEGRCNKDGVDLICIGYTYTKNKVLTFVLTKGADATTHGEPYEARLPDKFGNICIRHVARPDIIYNYFKFSNGVDVHNQARQYELVLETKSITQDPYFRLYTTMVGTNVTDILKLDKLNKKKDMTINEFADILASDIMNSAMKAAVSSDSVSTSIRITDTTINTTRRRIKSQQDQSSILSL